MAGWAVALGVFLILVASATSQGRTGGASLDPAPTAGGGAGERVSGGGAGPDERSRALDSRTRASIARLQTRLGLPATDVASAAGRRALVARMPRQGATWYGPGLYGRRTACGQVLRRSTVGVAHRRLPCGTEVTFYRGGRFRTVEVIDRGPYAPGLSWDLTAAAAKSLGLAETARVRVIH